MSLFPAYNQNQDFLSFSDTNQDWLTNSSFKINAVSSETSTTETNPESTQEQDQSEKQNLPNNKPNEPSQNIEFEWSSESTDSEKTEDLTQNRKKHKQKNKKKHKKRYDSSEDEGAYTSHKKSKHKKSKYSRNERHSKDRHSSKEYSSNSENPSKDKHIIIDQIKEEFEICKKRNIELLTVDKIHRPSAPLCHIKYYLNDPKNKPKKSKKFKRYYQIALDEVKETPEDKLTKKELDKSINIDRDSNFKGFRDEENMSQMTANFNRALGENPNDVDMWLKYIYFQDTVFQFEKTYRKGSIAKGLRVTAERKLAILDKALSHNPSCEKLLRERLNVAVGVYPSDELQVQLEKWLEKEQGNIILWQGYIEATQCSMSHCTSTKVLQLYTKCLSTIHKLRRSAQIEKYILEEYILRMLYQCGLFLRQAGLFEQMWTLIRLYLELNLNHSGFPSGSPILISKDLEELEEVVLKSGLPLHELWLRTEKLRECCNWLPYNGSGNCTDPQRLVFTEDVSELIHPIAMPGNTFRLIAIALTLLKIPLLPHRHTTIESLGLDYVPWSTDCIEVLLPMYFNCYPIDVSNGVIDSISKLSVGPQYLRTLPGQDTYLEFALKTMQFCFEHLNGNDKIAGVIWWFRFCRLLLNKKGTTFNISAKSQKQLKSVMKNTLKQPEFRSNSIIYVEYAWVEYELGNIDAAINVLLTTINSNYANKSITSIPEAERSIFCYLYRNLIEMHVKGEIKSQKIIKYSACFALGKPVNNPIDFITQGSVDETALTFKHFHALLLSQSLEKLSIVEHFLPCFFTDLMMCYAWFLSVTKNTIEVGVLLEQTIEKLDEINEENSWQKEVLYEYYVCLLFRNCLLKPGAISFNLLNDALHRALDVFPNNMFLLSVLMKEQDLSCSLGTSWWKVKRLLMKSGHSIPMLFLVLISNQYARKIGSLIQDTNSSSECDLDCNLKHRMLNLFVQLTEPGKCTRRCGLVWRLYLQFLHCYYEPKKCRDTYYTAVEELPWLKALYIDAAVYIPAELAQIQDLLIEKDLRIHMTPEELDILRS